MQRIRLNFLPVHLCPPLGRAVALSQLEVSGKSRGKVALRRLLAQRLVVVHGGKGEEGRFMYTWRVVQLGWCLGCHASRGLGGCLGGCLGGFPGRQLAFALPLGTPLLVGGCEVPPPDAAAASFAVDAGALHGVAPTLRAV